MTARPSLPTPIYIVEGDDPEPLLVFKVNGVAVDLTDYENVEVLLKRSKWEDDADGVSFTDGAGLTVVAASGQVIPDWEWADVRDRPWYVARADVTATGKTRVFGYGPIVPTNV